MGFHGAEWAMIFALNYAVIVNSIAALAGLDSSVQALAYAILTLPAIAGLFVAGPQKHAVVNSPPIGIALILFAVLSALSVELALIRHIRYDGNEMWRQLLLTLLPMILFWAARFWAANNFRLRAVEASMITLLGLCAASVLLDFTGILPFEAYGSRHFGFLGDSVAWLATIPTVYFMLRGKLGLLALCLVIILLTQTRAALVVIAAAVAIHFIIAPALTPRTYAIRLLSLIVGVLAAFVAQSLASDFLDRFSGVSLTDNDRVRTIQFTLEVFADHPLFGSGFNAHTYFSSPYQAAMISGMELWATPVSSFAQVLADAGLVGFTPFIVAMLMLARTCFFALRLDHRNKDAQAIGALAAWLLGYLVFNQSAAWFLPGSMMPPLVFSVAGIVVGATGQMRPTGPHHPRQLVMRG